jgi:hypothetical protein
MTSCWQVKTIKVGRGSSDDQGRTSCGVGRCHGGHQPDLDKALLQWIKQGRQADSHRAWDYLVSLMHVSSRSSAALAKVHILASRSVCPVSTVMARSTGPVTAIQAWPAASP